MAKKFDFDQIAKLLYQAAADGGFDGTEHEIGLDREKGNPIVDSRLKIDGFRVKIAGDQLTINYTMQESIENCQNRKYIEDLVNERIGQISSFITKRYKELVKEIKTEATETAKNSISLKSQQKSPNIRITILDNRAVVVASHRYQFAQMEEVLNEEADWREIARKFIVDGKKEALRRNVGLK